VVVRLLIKGGWSGDRTMVEVVVGNGESGGHNESFEHVKNLTQSTKKWNETVNSFYGNGFPNVFQ
jgi:hypothetical protein